LSVVDITVVAIFFSFLSFPIKMKEDH